MEQITFNPNNEPYYSEDFIKGFKCGAERQFEADKRDADRPQGKWIDKSDGIEGAWNYCSVCGEQAIDLYDFCPNCGAKMDGEREDE